MAGKRPEMKDFDEWCESCNIRGVDKRRKDHTEDERARCVRERNARSDAARREYEASPEYRRYMERTNPEPSWHDVQGPVFGGRRGMRY